MAAFEIAGNPLTLGEYAHITGEWPGGLRGERLPVEDDVGFRIARG